MQVSKNFYLHEFVPEKTYNELKEESIKLIDPKIFIIAQALRDKFGRAVCNNWYTGGSRQYSGYRPPDCDVGAKKSMHKQGKACDLVFLHNTAESIRNKIKADGQYWFDLGIRRIENVVSWIHFDLKEIPNQKTIKFFIP